jgi:hypothetical protein
MNSLVLPEAAGFPTSNSPSDVYLVMLEIHYDNPDGDPGHYDNSGIRLYVDTQLRTYDAGHMILGDAYGSFFIHLQFFFYC